MDVVLTFEGMWILLFVIDALYLNRSVVKLVLATEQVSHLRQSLQRLGRLDVTCHGNFSDRDSPNMQIVQINDVVAALVFNVLSELFNVD